MNGRYGLVVMLVTIFAIDAQAVKKTVESRAKLQESIAYCARDIIKTSNNVLKVYAKYVRNQAHNNGEVATIIECIADAQTIMFDILQELLEGGNNDRWALASRESLIKIRDVLRNVMQQMSEKESKEEDDVQWWKQVCLKIKAALPAAKNEE